MYELEFQIKLLSDLVISHFGSDNNRTNTMSFIPGNVIRGALANWYIKENGIKKAHEDVYFQKFFLNNQIRIENAYIAGYENDKIIKLLPIPFFIQKDKEDYVYNAFALKNDEISEKNDLKPLIGYYQGRYYSSGPEIGTNFHMSRTGTDSTNRLHGTSEDGQIFHYESIKHGQTFCGSIHGEETIMNELINAFHLNKGQTLKLQFGRSRNTQYGLVEFFITEDIIESERLDKESIRGNQILVLESPAILLNQYGYSEVSKKILEEYLTYRLGSNINVIKCYIKSEIITGYVGIWKNKHSSNYAFAAGSSFEIDCSDINLEKLQELLDKGIGEKTNEGLGKLTLATQYDNGPVNIKEFNKLELKTTIKQDNQAMTDTVKQLFKLIVSRDIMQQIKQKGYDDALEYWNLADKESKEKLNSHMIGRLESMLDYFKEKGGIAEFSILFMTKKEKEEYQKKVGTENAIPIGTELRQSFLDKIDIPSGDNSLRKKLLNGSNTVNEEYQNLLDEYDKRLKGVAELNVTEIQAHYWKTYFRQLRNYIKQEQRRGNNE